MTEINLSEPLNLCTTSGMVVRCEAVYVGTSYYLNNVPLNGRGKNGAIDF